MMRYLSRTVTLDDARCNGCRRCLEVCPHGVFAMASRKARVVDRGACERNCVPGALRVHAGVGCAYTVLLGGVAERRA